MQSTIRRTLPAALSVALVAGALAVPAIATTDDGSEATASDAVEAPGERHRHPLAHAALHDLEEGELAERLAAELGLDTGAVQDALDAVRADLLAERLDEAVADGRLSREQADRIEAAAADGTLDEVLPAIRLEQLEARLAERVAAGELSQEEADALLERAEDGDWPGRRGHRGHRRGGPGPDAPTGGGTSA